MVEPPLEYPVLFWCLRALQRAAQPVKLSWQLGQALTVLVVP
jgi:hypothetical protein